jgi:hypothetical protein
MQSALATLLILAPLATARLTLDVDSSKQYPVTKVILLLKDMQAQLEKEAEEDEEIYDKMKCWCVTNDREKSVSLKEAESRISNLQTTIESSSATSGRLKTEIAYEDADLKKAETALAQLTSMREKEQAAFNAEEKDMLQSVKALGDAIIILSKHHGGAEEKSALATISQVMQSQMHQHQVLLQGVITPHQKRVVMGLLQQPTTQFRTYQPQSSEIFGILRQMKETFEANLSDSQKEELANAKAYQEQKSAKEDEIKAIANSLSNKKSQLAKSDELNAQSKEDLKDTQDSLSIDDTFLQDLKVRCAATDSEWELRQKSRQEELTAIAQAISILSADDAHDTFSKTFNAGAASFLQRSSGKIAEVQRDARKKAVKMLWAAAIKSGNPALSSLAMAAQLDAFTKVKEAIDKMVVELKEEKAEEVQQKDSCTSRINENTLITEKEVNKKSTSEMKIQGLEQEIKELTEAIEVLQHEVTEANVQIKQAGENREKINKEFQETVADQRETQKLLQKAITVLKAVYVQQTTAAPVDILSLNQENAKSGQTPAPPPGFNSYNKNSGGGGAVALLEQIMGDAKVLEAEAVKDEQKAQETYESFVKDTNAAITSKNTAITNKGQDKASAEQDLESEKTNLASISEQLTTYGNTESALKLECDFLLKNFDVRQTARDEEIEALQQAKAILSGMQVDDAALA